MAIFSGTRLGVYQVTAMIGAGGMGEVYRARDTRLDRDVALKVLPEAFARDPQRMARFEREAKLLASLNHPNIAAIYGIEESGPIRALVMELVEGPNLAERIRSRAIPIDQALPIARQIVDAVEYAHEQNVIHRDLKPANIKVKADGTVKVLDFGLAKALSDDPAEGDMSNSPTLSMAATRQGVILGTAAYMSPEQAEGKRVDRRTDVWAFGVVLYEMLVGKHLFTGETVSETLASVLKEEPALDKVPADTPQAIRTLLRRCLERSLRRRLVHIGEARIIIEDVLSGTPAEPIGAPRVPALGSSALALGLGALLTGAVIAGMAAWTLKPAPEISRPVSRFGYDLPQGQQLRVTGFAVMALSPDGSRFVYNTTQGLYLRSLDELEARVIPGTEQILGHPFFSPDGRWVGYWQDNQIKKISISGGAPVTICPVRVFYGISWAADDTMLFADFEGIQRVSANGGTPELVIEATQGEQFDGPQLLPGGEQVLFTIRTGASGWDDARIVVQSLETKERREIWRGGSDARYVSTGHIVYAIDDALFAIPFDLNTRAVTGGLVPLVEGVFRASIGASANYGISDNGSLVYVSGSSAAAQRTLAWVDRRGNEQPLSAPARGYDDLSLSPDGRQVAVQIIEHPTNSIWIYDIPRGTMARLTFEGNANLPVWTPDGRRVVYRLTRNEIDGLFWKSADGSGPEENSARLYPVVPTNCLGFTRRPDSGFLRRDWC